MITRYIGRPSEHTMVVENGQVMKHGRGLNCFVTRGRHVLAVPSVCMTARIRFSARSLDLQPVEVDGDVTYKVVSPTKAATSFDFSVDPKTGVYMSEGPVALRKAVLSITRDLVRDEVSRMSVECVLGREHTVGRAALIRLRHSRRLKELGVSPVHVFVKELRVGPEIARAIERRMTLAPVPNGPMLQGSDLSLAWNPPSVEGSGLGDDGRSAGMECTDSCPFRHLCGDYMNDVKGGKAWCTLFREFST